MNTVKFRPLRLVKNTGKIVVANYLQWRKFKSADFAKYNLEIIADYKTMRKSDFVYNHKGEQLFFFSYKPSDIPICVNPTVEDIYVFGSMENHAITFGGSITSYNAQGIDCDGIPFFSHLTADYIGTHYTNTNMNDFEPLTVGMVVHWLGWCLMELNNSYLTFTE